MFKFYRELERGEFIVTGGDCAQGGEDSNVHQFLSHTKLDVPIVFDRPGVAADMTPYLHRALEKIHDVTGVKPVVALERQMGGASEMSRLKTLNIHDKYTIFIMPTVGAVEEGETNQLGYNMSGVMRPTAIGDLKNAVDTTAFRIYDPVTIQQLFWFIINRQGKPEAMNGKHDDHVMSLAVVWQLYQLCVPPIPDDEDSGFPEEDLFDEKTGLYL